MFSTWRAEEYGWVQRRILALAWRDGEFHADRISDIRFVERNIIGAAVRALVRRGLIESTGEHRKSSSPAAHGRRSYVYRLTEKGLVYSRVAQVDANAERLRVKPPEQIYLQESLFGE